MFFKTLVEKMTSGTMRNMEHSAPVLSRPDHTGIPVTTCLIHGQVEVLAVYDDFMWIRTQENLSGWIKSEIEK